MSRPENHQVADKLLEETGKATNFIFISPSKRIPKRATLTRVEPAAVTHQTPAQPFKAFLSDWEKRYDVNNLVSGISNELSSWVRNRRSKKSYWLQASAKSMSPLSTISSMTFQDNYSKRIAVMTPPLIRKTSDVVADTAVNKTPATGDEAGPATNSFFMFAFCKKNKHCFAWRANQWFQSMNGGGYCFLPFLPATPSSRSQPLIGFLSWVPSESPQHRLL